LAVIAVSLSVVLVAVIAIAVGALVSPALRRSHATWRPSRLQSRPDHRAGVRVLDNDSPAPTTPSPERPALDPTKHYIFGEGESALPEYTPVISPAGKHSEQWALERSLHGSRVTPRTARALVVAVVVLVVLSVAGVTLASGGRGATTTTTTVTPSVRP
jgi:hypothetical protein